MISTRRGVYGAGHGCGQPGHITIRGTDTPSKWLVDGPMHCHRFYERRQCVASVGARPELYHHDRTHQQVRDEVEALRSLARIRRFSSRPIERILGWQSVAKLSDHAFEQERFPTGLEVIRDQYGRMRSG